MFCDSSVEYLLPANLQRKRNRSLLVEERDDSWDRFLGSVFEQIVTCIGEAMDLKIGKTTTPLVKKMVVEAKVAGSPAAEYWFVGKTREFVLYCRDESTCRVVEFMGNVSNETPNSNAVCPRVVRKKETSANNGREGTNGGHAGGKSGKGI